MKTADRENLNCRATMPSNRAHGAAGQNRSCSLKWAVKQEKLRPSQKCFFLTSPFIEQAGERRDKPACCRGCKSPTGKESSESILASSLAGDTVRCRLKRRQRYRWAGLLSFEKPMEQDADSIPRGGRQYSNHASREWIARSCVV